MYSKSIKYQEGENDNIEGEIRQIFVDSWIQTLAVL